MPTTVQIPCGRVELSADLDVPNPAVAVVAFAHGTGSGRHSPRNRQVADKLREAGLATLLLDLLTEKEERVDIRTGELRFDIPLLAGRLTSAVKWLTAHPDTSGRPIGCFGASTGAAAALVAAAREPGLVRAVVSRGGRPDLAGEELARVRAPTLLIVGGRDEFVLDINRRAQQQLPSENQLEVVAGATHLFEEPGALETVADLARDWFLRHLAA